ncbi:hypothetical protein GJU93_02055 [Brucella sp. 10RB9212]|uniref:zonular occludens toxin domain-containing protein n=1 Tax=unclassified Brucella TaxID=2632610 RepID=UPI000972CDCE|nr:MULTISPECIES: zonular occludens toxin domain-containing protein [unclassified Brucella]APY15758.1 hypothetical protein BKD02_15945 [Brucella sp. 09RB8910]MRN45389.1 hypothetical protein [Brucella sp. 10RB9212]
MITLITGTPGSGKSYEAVAHHILPALNSGRKVITNLPLNINYYMKINPSFDRNLFVLIQPTPDNLVPFSTPADFADEWKNKDGVGPLYVVDEAHMAFPRGDKDKKMLEYFTMHRHTGADILLITQQLNQLRREISGLVEVSFVLKKNTVLGSSKSYRKQTRDGTKGSVIATAVHRYDPQIFKFYQSYTLGGQAEAVQKAKPIWFRWPFIAAALAFLYVAYAAASGGLNPFGTAIELQKSKTVKTEPLEVPKEAPKTRYVVSAPPDPTSDKSSEKIIVTDNSVTHSQPEKSPEPVVVVEPFDFSKVDDQTSVRAGNLCRITLHIAGKKVDTWLLNRSGYEIENKLNEGEDRERYGGCTMTIRYPKTNSEYVFHMNKYAL